MKVIYVNLEITPCTHSILEKLSAKGLWAGHVVF